MKRKYRILDVDRELLVMDQFNLCVFAITYSDTDDRDLAYEKCFKFIELIKDPQW